MSTDRAVCLVGFGEVGEVFAADLRSHGVRHLVAWDIKFANRDSGPSRAARACQIEVAADAATAVSRASLILSAVTAAQDVAAAQSVARHLRPDALFVDFNSVSPAIKQQTAAVIHQGSGRYVEAAIMAPIAPKRVASPILLGGPHAAEFAALARDLGLSGVEVFSDTIGQASAAKMCRSVIVKGMEALLAESLLAARHFGVEDTVLQSLQNLLPGSDWRSLARYMISRSVLHGTRRAEEMREVAATVRESGLHPWMSDASAERQQWAAQFRHLAGEDSLAALLDQMRATTVAENEKC